jgi:hypothetical protein
MRVVCVCPNGGCGDGGGDDVFVTGGKRAGWKDGEIPLRGVETLMAGKVKVLGAWTQHDPEHTTVPGYLVGSMDVPSCARAPSLASVRVAGWQGGRVAVRQYGQYSTLDL